MLKIDSQQVELVGTSLFEAELTRKGFEVAKPRRDRGVDLVIYTSDPSEPFRAVPVQLKVSTTTAFSLDRKYTTFTGLVIGYVWDIHTTPRFFLLTYPEAAAVAGEQALSTPSWEKSGYYAEGPITKKRLALLEAYENRWEWLRGYLAESVIRQTSDRLAARLG